MKVVVTGGAGFIGSSLCKYLVENTDFTVLNVDKLTYASNRQLVSELSRSPRYRLHEIDICAAEDIDRLFKRERPNAVLHLAAESHVDRSIDRPAVFLQTNVMGTYSVLEASRRLWESLGGAESDRFRFLHVSTDEVYGSLGEDGMFTEETPYDPRSPYSASKAASDHLVSAWHHTYGLPVLISNCCNNYGPYHFPEKLIPLAILNAIEGKAVPVYGKGQNVRDWLYVEDHVRALLRILAEGRVGEKYNVGARAERTNLAVVEAICDLVDEYRPDGHGRRALITFVPDRPGHDLRYAIDPSKIENELGWRAEVDFEVGLRRTVEWYLANETWWRPLRESIYGGERLGLSRQHVPTP